jgi:methoxymalonate biosynthesis acyl carrier protein
MNASELELRITRFFGEELNVEVAYPDTDLVETGILDSLTFVNLLVHLEQEFGMEVSLDDLDIGNFCSIAKIAKFVMRQTGAVRLS